MQANILPQGGSAPTFLHRLDPRTKLALVLISFIMVLLPRNPAVVGLATLIVLAQVALARAWRVLIPIRWLLFALALFSVAAWSFLAQGDTLLFWRVSTQSLEFGLANFLKLATMMVAGLVLLATTPADELFLGLVRLGLPYPGAFAFGLALRWVPQVYGTVLQVKEAQQARGLSWETGTYLERLKRHLPLLVPIFLLTLRRSQSMAWALEARGFQMRPHRTFLLELHPTWRDSLALAVAALCLALFIVLHLYGYDRIPGLHL